MTHFSCVRGTDRGRVPQDPRAVAVVPQAATWAVESTMGSPRIARSQKMTPSFPRHNPRRGGLGWSNAAFTVQPEANSAVKDAYMCTLYVSTGSGYSSWVSATADGDFQLL